MDCYYHGHSGSPGGRCSSCDREGARDTVVKTSVSWSGNRCSKHNRPLDVCADGVRRCLRCEEDVRGEEPWTRAIRPT